MFSNFVKTLVEPNKEKPRMQPTPVAIKATFFQFPGDCLCTKLSKNLVHVASGVFRRSSLHTPSVTLAMLQKPRCLTVPKKLVFTKKLPPEIINWPLDASSSRGEFAQKVCRTNQLTHHQECSKCTCQCKTYFTRGH